MIIHNPRKLTNMEINGKGSHITNNTQVKGDDEAMVCFVPQLSAHYISKMGRVVLSLQTSQINKFINPINE